jgi:hypothetical protein
VDASGNASDDWVVDRKTTELSTGKEPFVSSHGGDEVRALLTNMTAPPVAVCFEGLFKCTKMVLVYTGPGWHPDTPADDDYNHSGGDGDWIGLGWRNMSAAAAPRGLTIARVEAWSAELDRVTARRFDGPDRAPRRVI